MKPSQNTLDSLSDIDRVETAGDIRRIGGQMLLALARKEISATDIDAAAKMVAAQALHMAAEVKVAKAAIELRERGAYLGKVAAMGRLVIGTPKQDDGDSSACALN